MGRKRKQGWMRYVLGSVMLLALIAAVGGWWHITQWKPSRDIYAMQGVLVSEQDAELDFRAAKAIGAQFAYIEASRGADDKDGAFTSHLADAQAAELQVGAVHRFDPCSDAEDQAANFVTVVPRDAALLPPAIELDATAATCENSVSDAAVESELMTFLNQVETHVGQPAVLKLSRGFEDEYGVAARLGRNLWVTQDRFAPDYAKRPWAIWTANTWLRTEASPDPLRWLVVQP